jgi:hypothetical protein
MQPTTRIGLSYAIVLCGAVLCQERIGFDVMEKLLIAGFVEKQHETNTLAWSGKTTEGQDSPSDCHKTAKIMPDNTDEDFLVKTYHP